MNLDYAKRWGAALGSDIEAYAALYADDLDFTIDQHMMDDHMADTITSRAMIREQLGPLASGENGTHTFEVTEYIGDERYGMIHWNYTCEGADSYRGLPADGRTLRTKGSTFLQFNSDGKIVMESTCINDNPIFQELGIPVQTPHYWDADFDPAALMA